MEAAGMCIGAVSLLFQIFSGCIKGYQLLSEARGLGSDHQFFRIRFKTEQYRLLDWARIVKLDKTDETLDISKASRPILLDILDQQYRLMFRFGRLDETLRPLSNPLLSEEQEPVVSGSTAPGDIDSLPHRFPDDNSLLTKSLNFFNNTSKFHARLKWISSDKSKIESLIGKLTSLNDYLDQLLNNEQLQCLLTQQTRTNYQIMQLNNKMDDLCELVKACSLSIHLPNPPPSPIAQWPECDAAGRQGETGLGTLAQFKALMSAIENESLTENFKTELGLTKSPLDDQPLSLSSREVELLEGPMVESNTRVRGCYKPSSASWRHVWVEWNKTPFKSHSNKTPAHSPTLSRFEALIKLLRQDEATKYFRTMKCLGYYVHEQAAASPRCGFVFENPDGLDPNIEPTSLIDLIIKTPMPSLSVRIKLMRALAECIERLHAVNWLHKGLRSQNVIFFPEDELVDFSSPYLSGFDYSRPLNASFMSENPPAAAADDMYRHPAVQGNPEDGVSGLGFKKQHDIYALGVVFLEIIYWKPIFTILGFGSAQAAGAREIVGIKNRLLREGHISYVRGFVGDNAADIVMACLEGPAAFGVVDNAQGIDSTSTQALKLQGMFFEVIVKKLQRMSI